MAKKKDILSKETDQAEKEMLMFQYQTALKKVQFINEIKNGLGSEIKTNAGKVRVVNKSWLNKIIEKLRNIFTKF